MRELLVLLLVLPIGLAVVLSDRLSTFEPPAVVAPPITVPLPGPTPTVAPVPSVASPLEGIVDVARAWLGVPYLWSGCGRRGVDCSCFVLNVWAQFGVHLPRTTVEQIRWAIPIPREQATLGDLVFFSRTCSDCGADPTHVGLVIDPARNLMIDAGDPVKIESFDTPYWRGHYMAMGRVR